MIPRGNWTYKRSIPIGRQTAGRRRALEGTLEQDYSALSPVHVDVS